MKIVAKNVSIGIVTGILFIILASIGVIFTGEEMPVIPFFTFIGLGGLFILLDNIWDLFFKDEIHLEE